MQGDDRAAETALKALQGLGREADFGNQHQGLVARGQGVGDQLQIDFGLAAAGDALQQKALEAVAGRHFVDRRLLFGVELQWCFPGGRRGRRLRFGTE